MESEQEHSGQVDEGPGEEKTDRDEGGPTSGEGDAPEEGAEGTRPNPMPSHE